MAIPKPSQTKQPILNYLARTAAPVKLAALIEEVGRHFNLTKVEMEDRMPSGMGRLVGTVNAAAKEMKAARLVQSPRFGYLEITTTGREAIQGTVAPQQPVPASEAPSPSAQPSSEQEAPKPEAQPASKEESQESQTPPPASEEAPAKRRGRPRKSVDSLPAQPGNEQKTAKPKGRPKKKVDSLPPQPVSKKVAAKPEGQPDRSKKVDVPSAQPSQKGEAEAPQPQPVATSDDGRFVELTSQIVSSYVARTTIDLEQVPEFIKSTHAALAGLGQPESDKPATSQRPAVPIEESVIGDYIICLEDGRKFRSIKRHIREKYNLLPHEYRVKWGLPPDYPMVAPDYAEARSENAKRLGLGRKVGAGQKRQAG